MCNALIAEYINRNTIFYSALRDQMSLLTQIQYAVISILRRNISDSIPPSSNPLLIDADGAYIVDSDNVYIES